MDTLGILHKALCRKTSIASKTSLQQILRNAYLAKAKFSEDEAEMLADMLQEVKRFNTMSIK